MAKVAIVYHSAFGHTRVQAEAVYRGASRVRNVDAILIPVEEYEAHWDALDHADAIVMGAPTYMAGASAQFKAFLDATSSRFAEQRWKDKLAAGFTNSAGYNGDKLNTLQQFNLFAMQHGMIWVGLGLLAGNTSSQGSAEELNRLSSFLGAMAQSSVDQPADVVPPRSDRATAEYLGERVAAAALKWRAGTQAQPDGVASEGHASVGV